MYKDNYGQQIFTENDICDLYLQDPDRVLTSILVDIQLDAANILELENFPKLIKYQKQNISVNEFDRIAQDKWFLPESYRELDIAQYVLNLCKTEVELQRVGEELLMFQERDMFDLLKYLKYLVDTMRQHNVVWGVGRGSSVASYVLFLIGVHKIDSIFYDLSIEEFLK